MSSGEKTQQVEFKCLFDTYYARLVRFSFHFVGEKAVAEDIVQDAFMRYWNCRETVSMAEGTVKSYFYTSVRNASLNSVRHAKVEELYISRQDAEMVEQDVVHAIMRSEIVAELYSALNALPAACREVSIRSFIREMKNQEIAEELGISINTVKTQKQRALKILRLRLSPELFAVIAMINC